jgi:septum formation protein
MDSEVKIVLASSSPRRHELFKKIGLRFLAAEPKSSESSNEIDPTKRVIDNAISKVLSLIDIYSDSIIIGADTIVYQNGQILGKPSNTNDAKNMLKMLSGQKHQVYTGVAVLEAKSLKLITGYEETIIKFKKLSIASINEYVESGEPMGKAGSYAIQGIGADFVCEINGSWSNVVGLPVNLTKRLLKEVLNGHSQIN